jgi:dipicolinate synthase subunit B
MPLEYLIIAPCTGNTLAKIANGITDTAVTMAAKAHLRCDRPLLIALASNDAMSQNLGNVSRLLTRKSVFFTPMLQDDPSGKPHSLVADFSKIKDAFEKMKSGVQIRPLFI